MRGRLVLLAFLIVPVQWLAVHLLGASVGAPGLIQSSNLTLLGGFKIPSGGTDVNSANYGAEALAWNDSGGDGSLVVSGFAAANLGGGKVAEIAVPAQRTWSTSSTFDSYPTASFHQPAGWVDPLGAHNRDVDPGAHIGGLYVWDDAGTRKLIISEYAYFGSVRSHVSHFVASLDFSKPEYLGGPYEITTNGNKTGGEPADCGGSATCREGFVAGYITEVPAAFQSALGGKLLGGQGGLAIVTRTSNGPAAVAFSLPLSAPTTGKLLMGYPTGHATIGNWDARANTGKGPVLYVGGSTYAPSCAIPSNSRTLLCMNTLGTPAAFSYAGCAVGAVSAAGPVSPPVCPTLQSTTCSTDATGTILTIPNGDVNQFAIGNTDLSPYAAIIGKTVPRYTRFGTLHNATSRLTAKANSGTPTATVTVANAFDPNLSGERCIVGALAYFDPIAAQRDNEGIDRRYNGEMYNDVHGPLSYPYRFFAWAYDLNDLASAKRGGLAFHQVVPYASWEYTLPVSHRGIKAVGGITWDPVHARLFVAQKYAASGQVSMIHVFGVSTPAPVPGAPVAPIVALAVLLLVDRRRQRSAQS